MTDKPEFSIISARAYYDSCKHFKAHEAERPVANVKRRAVRQIRVEDKPVPEIPAGVSGENGLFQ